MREKRPLIAAARYFWEPVVLAAGLLLITAVMAVVGNQVLLFTLTSALIQIVLVIGLYIFVGNSGILAFGHITYAMIGAYAAAWLTMPPFKKSFALSLPDFLADNSFPLFPSSLAAAFLAFMAALITGIPLMRLSGISASIGTFTVLVIFNTIYSNWDSWTFGASTLVGIPTYVNEWVALGWVAVALLAATIHQKSRFGLALRASREDEVAARAAGINVRRQRLIAFAVSGMFMGVGGVLQAHFLGSAAVTAFWIPTTFIGTGDADHRRAAEPDRRRGGRGDGIGIAGGAAPVRGRRAHRPGHGANSARLARARNRPADAGDPAHPQRRSDRRARNSLAVRPPRRTAGARRGPAARPDGDARRGGHERRRHGERQRDARGPQRLGPFRRLGRHLGRVAFDAA